MKLEQLINKNTCVNKIRAMRMSYVPKEMEKCRNGCPNSPECENYKPVGRTQERYRDLNLYVVR
jgi:hypothetical protein